MFKLVERAPSTFVAPESQKCMRHVGVLLRHVVHAGPRARFIAAHTTAPMASQRGAFIVFEGGDRCGKTTQSQSLVEHLNNSGVLQCAIARP